MTAQSSYPRTGQRPGAATSGVKVAHWNGTENLPRDARNVNALDIITRLDALRDHVADLARAPQPLPPPVAEDAERRLITVVLHGAECRWGQALEAACMILLGPAVDAAAHPTWGLALRCARRIYSRRCRWTAEAIEEDAWQVEQVTGPWLLEQLHDLVEAEPVNVCAVGDDVEHVLRAARLRRLLDVTERLSAACRMHNEDAAREHAATIASLAEVRRA